MRYSVIIALLTIFALSAQAKLKKAKMSEIKDNHDFNAMTVNGKYQYPFESTASVEDDKLMSDLLEPRKDFKDRLKQSYMRR